MSSQSPSAVGRWERIQVLLAEYELLRAEIQTRIGHRFAFLGLTGAVGGYGLFAADELSRHQLVVLGFAAVALLTLWLWIGQLIARCARRIAAIERQINGLAGEELLQWENRRLGSLLFHRFHDRFKKPASRDHTE